ncbi:MAG: hypothetical protein ABWX92_14865 [Mycetocola sp.]
MTTFKDSQQVLRRYLTVEPTSEEDINLVRRLLMRSDAADVAEMVGVA